MIKLQMIGNDHKGNKIYVAHEMLRQLLTVKREYDFESRNLDKYAVAHIIQSGSEFYLFDSSENLYFTIMGYLKDAAVRTKKTINNFSIIGENIMIAITTFYACDIKNFDINEFISDYGEWVDLEETEALYDAVIMSKEEDGEFEKENKKDEEEFGCRLPSLYWYLLNDGEVAAEEKYHRDFKKILYNSYLK